MSEYSKQDVKDVEAALVNHSRRQLALADRAWTQISHVPRERLVDHLRQPLDQQQCPALARLSKIDVCQLWQAANLTQAQFQAAVPSQREREEIEDHLAELGVLINSSLAEELLRVIQKRPKDIFKARPELLSVVGMSTEDFMTRYGFPLNGDERWNLLNRFNFSFCWVEQLLMFSRHRLLEHVAGKANSNRFAEALVGKFDGALTAAGLWFGFRQTESERKAWPHL